MRLLDAGAPTRAEDMKERTAVVIGLLLVPAIPAVTLVVVSILRPIGTEPSSSTIASALLVSYLYSLNAAVVVGLPAFLVLRYLRLIHWWSALVVGCGIGVLMAVVLPLRGRGSASSLLLDCAMGAASALVFWVIWERSYRARAG